MCLPSPWGPGGGAPRSRSGISRTRRSCPTARGGTLMLPAPPATNDLPEGRLPTDWERDDGVVVHSLTAHALAAMERHKWLESEKAGRDLGDCALTDWIERFWKGFTRAKL